MNPTASAPASTATSASSRFVVPQILTQVISKLSSSIQLSSSRTVILSAGFASRTRSKTRAEGPLASKPYRGRAGNSLLDARYRCPPLTPAVPRSASPLAVAQCPPRKQSRPPPLALHSQETSPPSGTLSPNPL